MNKEQALERLTALEDEAKKLREILEAPEKKERWRATNGGVYFFVQAGGGVDISNEDLTETDKNRYEAFNYFQFKEEAERIARVQLAYRKLDWAIRQFETVFGFSDSGYGVYLTCNEELVVGEYCGSQSSFLRLKNRVDAEYILSNYKAELLTFLTGGEK